MNELSDIKLPHKAKSWRLKYKLTANGVEMTFRERMIYEAGVNHGYLNRITDPDFAEKKQRLLASVQLQMVQLLRAARNVRISDLEPMARTLVNDKIRRAINDFVRETS